MNVGTNGGKDEINYEREWKESKVKGLPNLTESTVGSIGDS